MSTAQPETRTLTLEVQGMTCGSCEARIRDAVAALPGTPSATIDRRAGQVTIETTSESLPSEMVAAAITAAGYPARLA